MRANIVYIVDYEATAEDIDYIEAKCIIQQLLKVIIISIPNTVIKRIWWQYIERDYKFVAN